MAALRARLSVAQAAAQQDQKLKKQVELLQKQIETQQKMIQLLMEHMRKQPLAGTPVAKLQTQVATLENRSQQAARRDQQLAQGLDSVGEHLDALERNGPRLPAPLKELFLPSRTNESPLSIYGLFVAGYQDFPHKPGIGHFFFDEFEPIFLLHLNDHILLESKLEFNNGGVEVHYAQMDYIISDSLTAVAGRFLTPIGFFNERIQPDWINKLPDIPLMFRQVTPSEFALNGLQFRGASYLFCSPVKMEYALYAANGLGLPANNDPTGLANLDELSDTTKNINDAMSGGGRIGFWIPEWGLNFGFSGFVSRPYGEMAGPDVNLGDIDASYHRGNWDIRFEYANMFERLPIAPSGGDQGPPSPTNQHIRRRGLYAQVAYRPYDASSRFLQNTEAVFRYGRARFNGIDPNSLDLTQFDTPVAAPVDRDQYTFGINYYLYPSLVIKFAYEINKEHGIDLKDDVFLAQLAWGF